VARNDHAEVLAVLDTLRDFGEQFISGIHCPAVVPKSNAVPRQVSDKFFDETLILG
jgi:hypothetical protein